MEEKVIIRGVFSRINVFSIVFILLSLFGLIGSVADGTEEGTFAGIVYVIIGIAGAAFFYYLFNKCEITVTDKRVYGKAAFGRSVDLPFDMISSVGTGAFKGIKVATSSGNITFYFCQNSHAVYSAISNRLIERQNKQNNQTATAPTTTGSGADELKKYKDLLDNGVISQEEFDAKKKQLLGL
ncbi:MAG: SHOCT domain-containing protein [Ruminococcaceae bacterium]|nr:SHOCT domain-containing protein [Oscillospiraceae bacterium]